MRKLTAITIAATSLVLGACTTALPDSTLVVDMTLEGVHERCGAAVPACVDYNIPTGIYVIYTSTRDWQTMAHEIHHINNPCWAHEHDPNAAAWCALLGGK